MLKIFLKIAARIHNTDGTHIKNGHTEGTQDGAKPTHSSAEYQDNDLVEVQIGQLGGALKTVHIPRHLINPPAKGSSGRKYNT